MKVWRVGINFEMEGQRSVRFYATEELAKQAKDLLEDSLDDYEYVIIDEIDVLTEVKE